MCEGCDTDETIKIDTTHSDKETMDEAIAKMSIEEKQNKNITIDESKEQVNDEEVVKDLKNKVIQRIMFAKIYYLLLGFTCFTQISIRCEFVLGIVIPLCVFFKELRFSNLKTEQRKAKGDRLAE